FRSAVAWLGSPWEGSSTPGPPFGDGALPDRGLPLDVLRGKWFGASVLSSTFCFQILVGYGSLGDA
ncbi:MAG TPA: hypothetical protein VME22_17300, partial [Solirubrobacteraceae bacterium]|nr:hypothetical protein [Solirubrobacteraceae bacterium]